MTVEIRPTASAFQAGDAAIVNRAGNPATVVLGSAATKAEADFIASDGGTELATKAAPVAADQVIVFDSADDDAPKAAPLGQAMSRLVTDAGATPAVALTWNGAAVVLAHATPAVSIPANATTAFPAGFQLSLVSEVEFTVAGASGVDLNGTTAGSFTCQPVPGAVTLIRAASDDWLIVGDCAVTT